MSHDVSRADRLTARSSQPTCRSCGDHVSHSFTRVFGDQQDVVYGCPSCTTFRDLRNGVARQPGGSTGAE